MINKKLLSEREICTKFIHPSLDNAGWDMFNKVREEKSFRYKITDGKIVKDGKTIKRIWIKRADYILYYKNDFPIALIEAKNNKHAVGDWMQQWLEYAKILDIPFVYSTNWDAFLEHDRLKKEWKIEKELSLDNFPSPEELYTRYTKALNISEEQKTIIEQPYYNDFSWKEPRYYQRVAINRTLDAISKGVNRILLVMATWTGKTYTAFQIIWRLWKSKTKKRILFLADRNILVDQTQTNDFKPFWDIMTKIENRKVNKAFEIYLAIYQWITWTEDSKNIFKQFSPDFFDLIVVDECHRWSAKEDSAWREVLEYFSSATQIWMTATPKETKEVSNIEYFWDPIYTYSLKQGIEDGFLAPYRVVRVWLDINDWWRPYRWQLDYRWNEIEDRVYNIKDFDRNIVIKERTEKVAQKITQFLKESGDRFQKTIVFCTDIDHAERMRQALVNENADLVNENDKYIMRVTWDSQEWKNELDNFIDSNEKYPTIVTTSKLLTTWVDAKTCKLIVLDSNINSMTEFKQIIWRWTRLKTDSGKYYFTIMDFRQATNNFADPEFDWEPVQIYETKENDNLVVDEENINDNIFISSNEEDDFEIIKNDISINDWFEAPKKVYVNGVRVEVTNERVQYLWGDWKLITESLKDYSKKNILSHYRSLEDFIVKWNDSEKKEVIVEELIERWVMLSELEEEVWKNLDPFDLICHIAFDKPPLTRKERAENVKKRNYFEKYSNEVKEVLEALLEKYAEEWVGTIEDIDVLKVWKFREFWTPLQIIKERFWSRKNYLDAVKDIEKKIYEVVV